MSLFTAVLVFIALNVSGTLDVRFVYASAQRSSV